MIFPGNALADETKYWLWLSMVFGVGSRRIWEAMCLFETAEEAYFSLKSDFQLFNLNERETNNISRIEIGQAEALLEQCEKQGIKAVGCGSEEYPLQLRHIFNPPAVLYYKGKLSCLHGTRTVTAVGTRKATEYGIATASRICGELAKNNIIIVSGFALGIDAASHLAAAKAGRPTVCVLGCGVDVNYPKGNFELRDIIFENGGVFVSEYPPGTPPHAGNFPKRNRIMAALGRVAVIFEADLKSGSLITASLAAEQGRTVFCLPPADIYNSKYSGNIQLLRDGAIPLYESRDVLDCFKIGSSTDKEIRERVFSGVSLFGIDPLGKRAEKNPLIAELKKNTRSSHKTNTNKPPETVASPEKRETGASDSLSEIQRMIVRLLEISALHADVLAQRLGLDSAELMTELTELELLGEIRSLPGKIYEICE